MKYFSAIVFYKPEFFFMTVLDEKQKWKIRSYLPLNGLWKWHWKPRNCTTHCATISVLHGRSKRFGFECMVLIFLNWRCEKQTHLALFFILWMEHFCLISNLSSVDSFNGCDFYLLRTLLRRETTWTAEIWFRRRKHLDSSRICEQVSMWF